MNTEAISLKMNPLETSASADAVEIVVAWNGAIQDVVQRPTDGEDPVCFTVGEEPGCDFLIPAEELGGLTSTSLVEIRDGAVQAAPLPGAAGEISYGDGTTIPLDTVDGTTEIGAHGQLRMEKGPWTFWVRTSQRTESFKSVARIDWDNSYFIGASLLLHAVFFFIVYLVPPDAAGYMLDPADSNNRFLAVLLAPPEMKEMPVPDFMKEKKKQETADLEGQRHKGVEGKMGDRRSPRTNKRYAIKGPPDTRDIRMARDLAKEMASEAGVLGALTAQTAPTSPFGGLTAIGRDPENALGSLQGDGIGNDYGFGGLAMYGTGRGGGGTGEGSIGVGKLGFIGGAGRNGGGKGGPPGFIGRLTGRPEKKIRVKSTGSLIKGSLSKDVIRREVRRHHNEIRFCYEKGLRKRPDITGRVSIRFIISATGSVQMSAVSSSTLDDLGVEQCINKTVRRMAFPRPMDGGVVIVTYPFNLTSSGN